MGNERDISGYEHPPLGTMSFQALIDLHALPLTEEERASLERLSAETKTLLTKVRLLLLDIDGGPTFDVEASS